MAGIRIITIAYPAIGRLFGGRNAAQVLRQFFRLIPGYCTGTSIEQGIIQGGSNPPNLDGLQAEHPIDVSVTRFKSEYDRPLTSNQRQIIKAFPRATVSGQLPSGQMGNLPTLPVSFWQRDSWLASNALLAARPPVGGPNGVQPDSPNDRVMEAFGSDNYAYPFMAVDRQINGPKGRVMALHAATGIQTIRDLANTAVQDDTQADADALLQAVRVVSFHESNVPLVEE